MLAREKADKWIEESAVRVAAAAAVPIPVPGSHTVLCTAVEAYMIYNVAAIYGQSLTVGEAVAMIPTLGAAVAVGKTASSLAGELLSWVPVAGWVLKGAVGGTTAYAVGSLAVAYFEERHPGRAASAFEMTNLKDFVLQVFQAVGPR